MILIHRCRDGARSLHEIFDFAEIPSKLKKYINNYPLHVFEISKLENTDVFRIDLKQIFDYIRCSRDKKKLLELVQGENRLGILIAILVQKGENEIIMQVVQNEILRKEYYQKYGI